MSIRTVLWAALLGSIALTGCGGGGGTSDGGKAATTTRLAASSQSAASGAEVTFTATVAEATRTAIPTGTVTFLDGSTLLGTGTLDGTGVATYATSALAGGAHAITASYGGDAGNDPSSSSAVTVTVTVDVVHGQWRWMGGSQGALSTPTFGTKGKARVGNNPGARLESGAWTGKDGTFWLFGGEIYDKNGGGGIGNDMWAYDSRAGTFTFASGSTQRDQAGIYGTSSDAPGSRIWPVTWVGADGGLWLFGGVAYDAGGHRNSIAHSSGSTTSAREPGPSRAVRAAAAGRLRPPPRPPTQVPSALPTRRATSGSSAATPRSSTQTRPSGWAATSTSCGSTA